MKCNLLKIFAQENDAGFIDLLTNYLSQCVSLVCFQPIIK